MNTLGLHGLAKGFRDLEHKPEARGLDHAEWLGLLLEYETTLRRQKQFEGASGGRHQIGIPGRLEIGIGGRLHVGIAGRLRRNLHPQSFIRFRLSNLPDVSSHAGPVEVIAIVRPWATYCGLGSAQHRLLKRLNVDIGSNRATFFFISATIAQFQSRALGIVDFESRDGSF